MTNTERAKLFRIVTERDRLRAALSNLLDKLEVLGGCNVHDLDGEDILPEITQAREALSAQ